SVFLGDSMGELLVYYSLAQFAFVGGSLVPTGCHNVLEPAAMGLPVITGPSQFNFQTICERLTEQGALLSVPDERALADLVVMLFNDPQRLHTMGDAGKTTVAANRGALERIFALVDSYLPT
ncbi:MAG: 3-deoxy-D-manno-octulosonic acid transferase, partial [Pseudohongiella sp.]|nr:3-deoxy-D-manno-octulosonic acid transferase [Pseudohongiella sp.]